MLPEERAFKYNETIIDNMSKIAKPLVENFNINLINYRRFYYDGKLLYLSNNESWMNYVFNQKVWVSERFKEKIKEISYQPYVDVLWKDKPDLTDPNYCALYEYNLWYGISIYRKFKNYIEAFAFSGTRSTPEVASFYTRNRNLLERFILFFLEKMHPFIQSYNTN